jgi:multicomponent Na+:H+ antiporter subunit D
MTDIFPPALIFIAGALLIPLLKGRIKSVYMLTLPVIAFWMLMNIPEGTYSMFGFLENELLLRFDKLSMVFGYIFVIITFIGIIYALHVQESREHTAAYIYAGSALGVVFAGDLITLFIFWEMLTISALFIIWHRQTPESQRAGLRYLLVHLFGGVCLLVGIIMRYYSTGSLEFGLIGTDGLASYLILLGFGINAAIPPLHAWLTDAYPEATVTGAVFLSAFTTKTAVYVLARAFPGAEILIVLGAIMTVFPIFYAVLENDLRRVLAYSLINQVGFMVVAIGIGIPLAINGAAVHAFAHILYKALLFMSVGAVMYRLGTCKATELGGLYKTMPLTLIFCVIGAASISAFPLFSGFVAKSLIVSAAGYQGLFIVWLVLIFASAGVFHHAGIKIPYFTFFAHDSGKRPKEAPLNMLIAMGIAAFLCIFIGVYPNLLYNILPYPVTYVPYTADHVVGQLLLLFSAALAFAILMKTGYYPPEQRSVNLDTDWFYRKGAPALIAMVSAPVFRLNDRVGHFAMETLPNYLVWFGKNPLAAIRIAGARFMLTLPGADNKDSIKERMDTQKGSFPGDSFMPWSIGSAVSMVLVFFGAYLIIFYF